MGGYTPMMRQYLAIKEQYPDALLFFRLGDFYELFFDDAVTAARELEITLTGRDGGSGRVPMCGVPHHSAEQYIRQLIDKGYKVAICEQMEDPKTAKGVVRREVVRVITPGTFIEGHSLAGHENHYLAAVSGDADGRLALAVCDVGTGDFYVTEAEDAQALYDELAAYAPREVLLDEQAASRVSRRTLKQLWGAAVTEWNGESDAARDAVRARIQGEVADGPVRAATCLVTYLEATQKRTLAHITRIVPYRARQFLQLDASARRNLELVETIRGKERKGSLLWLLDRTMTAMGARLLRRWLDKPLLDRRAIEQRLDAVQFFYDHLPLRLEVREHLKGVYDLERLAGRIAFGSANARDLVQLRRSLEAAAELLAQLADAGGPLAQWARETDTCSDVAAAIAEALVDDPPPTITEGGMIREGYHARLDELRRASREGKAWIAELEAREREATGIKSLKVGYNRVFGYYIEVSKPNLHLVPLDRYERKQTLANAERFVTPELKEKEALILEAESSLVDLEHELFCALRDRVKGHLVRLQALARRIAELDVLQALADVSAERGYVRPELADDGPLVIEEGRHPVVEATLTDGAFVPNDVRLDDERPILLITGPNMAGKSTYMRQVALIVILAQMGCFVPAKRARIPIVDRIFTRIGASDDLAGGQSTFMVEMVETRAALLGATKKSLLLLDEIGRGTSTYDGMALAQAVIEYLHDRVGAKTLFSTHYHELTALGERLPGVVNVHAACSEQDGKVIFLHKILPGKADKSYGIHVAERAGLPPELIERARAILAELEGGETGAGRAASASPPAADLAEPRQLSFADWLFASPPAPARDPEEEAVLEAIRRLDPERTTPLEALQLLFEWKRRLARNAEASAQRP